MKNLFNKLFKRKAKEPDTSVEHGQNNNENLTVSTSYLPPAHEPNPKEEVSFIHCLVGNIVEEHYNKSEQKHYLGTKYRRP